MFSSLLTGILMWLVLMVVGTVVSSAGKVIAPKNAIVRIPVLERIGFRCGRFYSCISRSR